MANLEREVGKPQTVQDRGYLHIHVTQASAVYTVHQHTYTFAHIYMSKHAYTPESTCLQNIHYTHAHIHRCRTYAHLHACEYMYTCIPLHTGPYVHTYAHTCTYVMYTYMLCIHAQASPEVRRISFVSAAERLMGLSTAEGPLHLPTRQSPMSCGEQPQGRWRWRRAGKEYSLMKFGSEEMKEIGSGRR